MGMTLTTLHFYKLDRSEVEPNIDSTDLIRDLNAPWLSVLPTNDSPIDDMHRLVKLAKLLTKNNDAAALLFYYFDDDSFSCGLFRGGKKTAECKSIEPSWARFGKTLDAFFADDLASKAFRYAAKCQNLEEQWRLLEECVGTALYDLQPDAPRRVVRCNTLVQEIKAYNAALRKRPKQYTLHELPRAEWPESARAKQALFELLRPDHFQYDLHGPFFPPIGQSLSIPRQDSLLTYGYPDQVNHRYRLLLFDKQSGTFTDRELPRGRYNDVIWMTPEGNLVVFFHHILYEHIEQNSWGRCSGKGFVLCLDKEGNEVWRFTPDLEEYHLYYAHTSEEGIITLYSTHDTTAIWQIDGRTGKVLQDRQIPGEYELVTLNYVDALDGFIYATREKKDLVILDSKLEEKIRWSNYPGNQYIQRENLCSTILWDHNMYINPRSVLLFNLQDGTNKKLWLELPAFVHAMLPNGNILATNEKMNSVIIFDNNGQVAARFTLKGRFCEVFSEDSQTYIVEEQGPNINGFYYDSLSDETSIHISRLEPVT